MTTRLRNHASSGERSARARHSRRSSRAGSVAKPSPSSASVTAAQSIAARRAAIRASTSPPPGRQTGPALFARRGGGMTGGGRALAGEQRAFLLDAPAIAAEPAVAAHDAVARHQHGKAVGGAGPGDGAHRPGRADRGGDLGIAGGAAGRDLAQCAPHPRLKRGAANVERQIKIGLRPRDELHDALGPLSQLRILGNQGGGDQRPAERRRHRDEADRLAAAATPPLPRGHAEPLRGLFIGARAGAETGGVDRSGDALPGGERVGEPVKTPRPRIFARRRAGELLEDAVKMIAAHARGGGKPVEARHRLAVAQQRAGPLDRGEMARGGRALRRAAALARPEAGGFGGGGFGEEAHMLAPRQARGAARPAINAGRCDGIEETAVGAAVAGKNGRPAGLMIEHRPTLLHPLAGKMAGRRVSFYPALAFSFPLRAPAWRLASSAWMPLLPSTSCVTLRSTARLANM